MKTAGHFYRLRFLLGAAEASLYPVLYASCIPRFFAAEGPLPVSRGRRLGPLDTGRLAAYYIDTRYIDNG